MLWQLAVITGFIAKTTDSQRCITPKSISVISSDHIITHHMFAVVYLVVHHPAHGFEVAIVEKSRTVELHPQTQLRHTERADLWKHVAAQTHVLNKMRHIETTLKPTVSQRNTYRYLFRKTPLKRMSIMLSISALFPCSLRRHTVRQTLLIEHI